MTLHLIFIFKTIDKTIEKNYLCNEEYKITP